MYLRILQPTCSIVILFTSLQTLNFCLLTVPIFCSRVLTLDRCQEKKKSLFRLQQSRDLSLRPSSFQGYLFFTPHPEAAASILRQPSLVPPHHLLPSSFSSAFNEQFSHLIHRGNRDHATRTQRKNHHMNGFSCTPYRITIGCFSFSPENYVHKKIPSTHTDHINFCCLENVSVCVSSLCILGTQAHTSMFTHTYARTCVCMPHSFSFW